MGSNLPRSWRSMVLAVVALWLLLSAAVFAVTPAAQLGLIVFGLLTLVGAVAKLARPQLVEVHVAAVVYGVWLLLAPWVLDFGSTAAIWATSAAGVVVLALALPAVMARVQQIEEEPLAADPEPLENEQGEARPISA